MHPIERLRYIARATDEPAASLASEAAFTLGDLASYEPSAVLTACRRLLDRHPECGPLWWVGAHLMAASDPGAEARRVADELFSDPTPSRVDEELRANFGSSDVIAATLPCELTISALERSKPYAVRLIGPPWSLGRAIRSFGTSLPGARSGNVAGFAAGHEQDALAGSSVLVVEALAAGRDGYLVEPVSRAAIAAAHSMHVPVWVIAGTGRALPSELFDFALERSAADAPMGREERGAFAPCAAFAVAIGPKGCGAPAEIAAGVTCPPGRELLRRPV